MKLLHISDLHLGVQVYGYSMLEEQENTLKQVLACAAEQKVDAIVLAGDLYDRSLPGADAVDLLDRFLTQALCPVLAISGNHDSAERVGYGSGIFAKAGIHMQGKLQKPLYARDFTDAWGTVRFYFLPFVRPETARQLGCEARTTQDAVDWMLQEAREEVVACKAADPAFRAVLIAHQYLVADKTADAAADDIVVGGTDLVRVSTMDGFDYCALGHIHGRGPVKDGSWYSGSILPYSFKNAGPHGGLLVEIAAAGTVTVEPVDFTPLHAWRTLKGPIAELTAPENVADGDPEDYIYAVLTDDNVTDAHERLATVFPNLMGIDFDNARTRAAGVFADGERPAELPEMESLDRLFADFYEKQNGSALSDDQFETIRKILHDAKEAER